MVECLREIEVHIVIDTNKRTKRLDQAFDNVDDARLAVEAFLGDT